MSLTSFGLLGGTGCTHLRGRGRTNAQCSFGFRQKHMDMMRSVYLGMDKGGLLQRKQSWIPVLKASSNGQGTVQFDWKL